MICYKNGWCSDLGTEFCITYKTFWNKGYYRDKARMDQYSWNINHHFFLLDGGWADWVPWTLCSLSCGGGSQTRTRTCTCPTPDNGGRNCPGQDLTTQICNTFPCGNTPISNFFGSIYWISPSPNLNFS